MGNNGGFNPYRDANGRFADPGAGGKGGAADGKGGRQEVRAIWTDKPPPRTSLLGKVNPWAYSPSPLPPTYRGKKAAPKPAAVAKLQPPKVPTKYRDYSHMASLVDKHEQALRLAQQQVETASSRSRFPTRAAYDAAKTAAAAEVARISAALREARKDRNTYLDAMAKYRSQSDYRYDD